ncbi:CHASE3 domain-containing protein, partial [Archangium violaceum]
MIDNLSIARKLQLGFGVLVTLFTAIVWWSFLLFLSLADSVGDTYRAYEGLGELRATGIALMDQESRVQGYALTGDEAVLELLPQRQSEFLRSQSKAMELTTGSARIQELLQQLLDLYQQQYIPHVERLVSLRRDVDAGRVPMEQLVAYAREGRGRKIVDSMRGLANAIRAEEKTLRERRDEVGEVRVSLVERMLVGGGIVGPLLAVLLAWWLSRNITQPLAEAVGLTGRLASGDLTASID